MTALKTESFSDVGEYTIEIYEQHYDDSTSYFMQEVLVQILDPCILFDIS